MDSNIRIILIPVDLSYKGREDAEMIQDNSYDEQGMELALHPEYRDFTLPDFMLACNNQEIDLEQYWLTYVNFEEVTR